MSDRKPHDPKGVIGAYGVPVLGSFRVAAHYLGCPSASALRARFRRGIYPARFIVALTPTRPGIDLHALIAWIRNGRPSSEAPPSEASGPPG